MQYEWYVHDGNIYIHVKKKSPPKKAKGVTPTFHGPPEADTDSTNPNRGWIWVISEVVLPYTGSKSSRNEQKHFFWSSEVGSPRPTWDPIWHPTPCMCRNTPQKCHMSCILCVHMLFDTLPCSTCVHLVSKVSHGPWLSRTGGGLGPI